MSEENKSQEFRLGKKGWNRNYLFKEIIQTKLLSKKH